MKLGVGCSWLLTQHQKDPLSSLNRDHGDWRDRRENEESRQRGKKENISCFLPQEARGMPMGLQELEEH